MAGPEYLHRKLEAVDRSPTVEELKPGYLWVAVLRPTKNATDVIVAADAIWAKCTRSKSIASLLRALANEKMPSVRLIQGTKSLSDDQTLSSLYSVNGLCVVQAIYLDQDEQRAQQQQESSSHTTPLRDITNTANNQKSSFQPPTGKSESSLGLAASASRPTSRIRTSETPVLVSQPPTSAVTDEHTAQDETEEAWVDFVFERREHDCCDFGNESELKIAQTDLNSRQEWDKHSPEQRRYFVERSRKFRFWTLLDRRAFWIFYYKKFRPIEESASNPHTSFQAAQQFFDSLYKAWIEVLALPYPWRALAERCSLDTPELPEAPTLLDAKRASSFDKIGPRGHQELLPSSSGAEKGVHDGPKDQSKSAAPFDTKGPGEDQEWESSDWESSPSAVTHSTLQSPATVPSKSNGRGLGTSSVNALLEGRSVDQLELGVSKGAEILVKLRATLESRASADSQHWITAISNIEKQIVKAKTIVGVVGATGAGKSSVINAMLDQERLVPTNCMRACTAVVTEISYNFESTPFRAEIDFINRDDWMKELKTSFQDLLDSTGKVARECTNEDSEAGVAYAKMRAVYPLMSKENMETATIEQLMNHNNVKNLLGGSRSIEEEDPAVFYKQLQKYVDSKEKTFSREKKSEAEKMKAKQMEYWPLIRVVRLYVKAPALETGAVIVDLPGVHDSNQARAAVAQGYLKQCTGLWIVAPITRAVDDKSAKTLLGDTFKRQLKLDGGYDSVTFVCSKTDDISLTEAQDSLGLDEEVAPLYARSEELKLKYRSLKLGLEDAKSKKGDVAAAVDAADEELEIWEKLNSDLEDGKSVYAPKQRKSSKKRKRGNDSGKSRKRGKLSEDSDYEDNESDSDLDDSGDETASDDDADAGMPLDAVVVDAKISELKTIKKEGRREKAALEKTIADVRAEIAEVNKEQEEIDGELLGKCIRGRNEYSRGAIQQDFASGIRELDQEIAEEQDAANFNPEADARDYDAVAKSLPVFCVSSRGYQRLMGRLRKDKGISVFRDTDETEIPALQAHCQKLTIINREVACKRFLNNFSQLLNSLRLWSSSDGTASSLTDEQKRHEAQLLGSRLTKLDTTFDSVVEKVFMNIHSDIEDQLYDRYPRAIRAGEHEANSIQARWGAPVDRENRLQGGLYWATYKATVRREGSWTKHDFNNDLISPALKHITPGWEKVFARCVAQNFSGFASDISRALATFHEDVEKRAVKNGSSVASFLTLKQQLSTYKEASKDAGNLTKNFINDEQKEINRSFIPVIMKAMEPAYQIATTETGPGSYKRMKDAMAAHVSEVKHDMYRDSLAHVKKLLQDMLVQAKALMIGKVNEVFMTIDRDYKSVVIGRAGKVGHNQPLPMEQRKIRRTVLEIVASVDNIMRRALDLEPLEDDAEDQLTLPEMVEGVGEFVKGLIELDALEAVSANEESDIPFEKDSKEVPVATQPDDNVDLEDEDVDSTWSSEYRDYVTLMNPDGPKFDSDSDGTEFDSDGPQFDTDEQEAGSENDPVILW